MEASGNQPLEVISNEGKIPSSMKSHNTELAESTNLSSTSNIHKCADVGSKSVNVAQADGGEGPSKVPTPSRTLYYPSLEKCITLETDLQVLQLLFCLHSW